MGSLAYLGEMANPGRTYVQTLYSILRFIMYLRWEICDNRVCLFFLQGSMGSPGPEGVIGPRGESVSHFQSLTHT